MIFGILIIFTSVREMMGFLGRSLKRWVIPHLNMEHFVASSLVVSLITLVIVIVIGTVVISTAEGHSYLESTYFAFATAAVRTHSINQSIKTHLEPIR